MQTSPGNSNRYENTVAKALCETGTEILLHGCLRKLQISFSRFYDNATRRLQSFLLIYAIFPDAYLNVFKKFDVMRTDLCLFHV